MRIPLTAGLLLLIVAGAAVPAGAAQSAPTSVVVSGGLLGVATAEVKDFAVITLSGDTQTAQAALDPIAVTDARGSGEGWTLKLQATIFREWDRYAYVSGGKALPEGSLSLAGFSLTKDGSHSDAPQVAAGPYILDRGEVTVAVAGIGAGMGRFIFSPTAALQVAVPASAYARTYRSDLSLSVTSGP
ncbi:MAG TPA: WxL domain-containing protein [Acidimicrobiales bacterium]|nr:WxL domain-containing protein [Acidimicrobiales bacterium]